MSQVLETNDAVYKKLVIAIKKELNNTTGTGTRALTKLKLKSYWNIGQKLSNVVLNSSQINKFANDVSSSRAVLFRCRKFFNVWPEGLDDQVLALNWTSHILLSNVSQKRARNFYLRECLKNGWSENTLANAISKNLYDDHVAGKDVTLPPKIETPLFIYAAILENVVDGDTIDVRIDVGFHMWASQRLRLRGVNTAELKTQTPSPSSTAHLAKQFVIKELTPCSTIVVQTFRSDIYGRYIADVYYNPDFQNREDILKYGTRLNQKLIDEGLAKPMLV